MDSALLSSRDGYPLEPKSGLNGVKPPVEFAKRWEPRGFSRVAAAFSSYDGDLSLPLGLALVFKLHRRLNSI